MASTSRRTLTTATVLGAAALLTAGCAVGSPDQTAVNFAPADGVRVEIADDVRGENLMILTAEEGAEGVLLGALVNDTDEAVEISLLVADERLRVPVDAGGSVVMGTDDDVRLAAVPAGPGAMTEVTLSTPTHGAVTSPVPVLDGTLAGYEEYVPAP